MSYDFFILMKSELSLLLIIFTLIFIKVLEIGKNNSNLLGFINLLLIINLAAGFVFNKNGELFNGMFFTNNIIATEKIILNAGTLIISLLAFAWLKNHKHLLEFYILLLSTVLGMNYMVSSGNFLMFYLGLELATIPLAALANFDLEKKKSSEAAMKMILMSAFSSGIMLFGISILYGITGTLNLVEMAVLLTDSPIHILSLVMIFSGFAFKLSVVPFHLWTADVYEGAPVAVTSFLSVISKAAIVFVFISVLQPLFINLQSIFNIILFVSIILTITVGNLFALRQENIKRFLAFSSITQVGYILFGLSAGNEMGNSSIFYFLLVYIFSNLGAFGVVSLVSVHTGKENISDFKGFYKNNPVLSWIMAIALFSLAGVPPTAGFFGKMFLLTAGAWKGNYILLTLAALNMVISLYYYLKVVKAIFIDKNEDPLPKIEKTPTVNLGLMICMLGVVATGFASVIHDYLNNLFK